MGENMSVEIQATPAISYKNGQWGINGSVGIGLTNTQLNPMAIHDLSAALAAASINHGCGCECRGERWRQRQRCAITEIAASEDDIKKNTAVIFYRKDMKETKCPSCNQEFMENKPVRRLKCEHLFHKDCVDSWLTTSAKCPVCCEEIL